MASCRHLLLAVCVVIVVGLDSLDAARTKLVRPEVVEHPVTNPPHHVIAERRQQEPDDDARQPGIDYEICAGESINMSCPANHLVNVIRASYGRMQVNRCLRMPTVPGRTSRYSYVSYGCRTSEFNLNNRCFGRSDCLIRVPEDFAEITPCSANEAMYLEVAYECVEDRTGKPTTYTVSTTTGGYGDDGKDFTVSIILHGWTGATLELPLDNQDKVKFQPLKRDVFVFTNVTSVGLLRCADFKLTGPSGRDGSTRTMHLQSLTVESSDPGPPLSAFRNSYYSTDSDNWPATHGCEKSYTIATKTGDQPLAATESRIYVTLIGENGQNSTQLLLRKAGWYFGRGSSETFQYNLPPLGKVSCVNVRVDGEDEWFLESINVTSDAVSSLIAVNSWVPSTSRVPRGIVVCDDGSVVCLDNLEASCPMPPVLKRLKTLKTSQLLQALVEIDMVQFCPVAHDYHLCASAFVEVNKQCPDEQQLTEEERLTLQFASTLIENVCDDDLDVIGCHKNCLLEVDENGQWILPLAVISNCVELFSAGTEIAETIWPPLCQSHEFLNCAQKVVSDKCGQAIADVAKKVYGSMSDTFCDAATKPACPYSFKLSEGGCHKMVDNRLEWNDAANECSRVATGSHLAFVSSEAEQLQINKVLDSYSGSDCADFERETEDLVVWIGGFRRRHSPRFQWYYNATKAATTMCYHNWDANYPTRVSGKYFYSEWCTQMRKTAGYKWQHTACTPTRGFCFVCEVDV